MRDVPRIPPAAASAGGARPVEIVVFPGVQLLDVAGPLQVFTCANDRAAAAGAPVPYRPRTVAPSGGSVVTSSGLALGAAPLPRPATPVDTLVVPGGPGVDDAIADRRLSAWVGARADRARRVATVCTGAFLLAATGRLDGRRAATHWSACDELARRHPRVRVERDPIFVRDDPVWTSAGVSAGIDLALALVEADLGRAVALDVARYLVMFLKRPGGQAQFSVALSLQVADDPFGPLHEWIGRHLDRDLSLARLAAHAGMSERSFSRRYVRATGVTPSRAIERLRVEAARRMLSETQAPIKRVATRCGFGSEETLRRSFAKLVRTTPQAYRARFKG